jgi:GTP-binding protein
VEFVLGAASIEQFPEPLGWEAAFMGRSNSGKSSMLNRLLGRKAMARVSSEPGRTREVNFFKVVWRKGGDPFYVADFPGYGYARAPKDKVRGWGRLVGGYLSGGRGQKCFLLADVRRSLGEDEFLLLDLFRKLNTPAVVVATKCDKLSKTQRAARLAEWREALPPDVPLLAFSSLTGEGREELILEAMPAAPVPGASPGPPAGAPEAPCSAETAVPPVGDGDALGKEEESGAGTVGPDSGGDGPDSGGEGPESGGEGPDSGGEGPDSGGEGPDAGGEGPDAGK